MRTIRTVLIANRGEISLRVIRACKKLGLRTVLATSSADRESLPARLADRVICLGGPAPAASYLNVAAIVQAALGTGADAIHPGYGFLSEDPALAEACQKNDITFVGPSADAIAAVGNKLSARAIAERLGIATLHASGPLTTPDDAIAEARRIGTPVLVKAAAGGGGRGMRIVVELSELARAITSAALEAEAAFGDPTLYIERYVVDALHVEVQVIGDIHGAVLRLGDRDCSVQRHHQKVIEEAPAWRMTPAQRAAMGTDAVRLAADIGYTGVGTVEFLFDRDSGQYYFLEVNSRIQVEHPVTEEVNNVDIVALQFAVAGGAELEDLVPEPTESGHSIELRLNAEDPSAGFRPSPGTIRAWNVPGGPGVRVDTHCCAGYFVPPFYDSLLAKIIVKDSTRAAAIARARTALEEFEVDNIRTNLPLLARAVAHPDFKDGTFNTTWLERKLPQLAPSSPSASSIEEAS